MKKEELWQKLLLSPGNEDLIWELFHENSKNGHYGHGLSEAEVRARVNELERSLSFTGYPVVELPTPPLVLDQPLHKVILSRISFRNFTPRLLSQQELAALLYHAYGVTRLSTDLSSRSLRAIPSGGGLYPLEIFFHTTCVHELRSGLYHYNPAKNNLRLLREGDKTSKISESLLQPDLVLGASLVMFVTALFERSIFKYGDRGYRYILLEAGHLAQNVNLVVTALGLGCVNIGGFFDHEIDDFLDLDGITHSTIYMIAIGGKPAEGPR